MNDVSDGVSEDSRTVAIIAHLSAPFATLVSAGSLSLLGPLLIWLVKKDDPFVRRASAAAFNFNLLIWIFFLIGWLLVFTIVGIIVAIPLMVSLFAVSLWCHEAHSGSVR